MSEAWIIDAVRTPRGRGKAGVGALSNEHPQELLSQCLNALRDRNGIAVSDVEDVIAGCVSAFGEQGADIARNAVLNAGWPVDSASGVTLNRFCGSGQQAVNFAAMGVMAGQQELVIGGGIESMSRVPMGSGGGGLDGDNPHLAAQHPMVPQGISADLIASLEGFTRAQLDAFAAESLAKLKPSFEELGAYKPKGSTLTLDERALARYPQLKKIEHVHHAGTSSGIVDGASAVLLASPGYAKAHGLRPRARIKAMATAASEPIIMLTAPTPATQRCLAKAGMAVKDLDLIEINEAFAAIPLQTMRNLGMDPARVNVNGGAIALGHPLGATGGMLIGTLLDELERQDKSVGLVTMCIGGGMGIATILERI